MKKLFFCFLALVILFAFSSCGDQVNQPVETSFSEAETLAPVPGENNSYFYDEYSDHVVLTAYKLHESAVVLPETINSKPVTSFGDIFYGNITLAYVTIPGSYTSIDEKAFYNCVNLTSVTVSSPELTSIGANAFFGCQNLATAKIPATVTDIHEDAFKYCTDLIVYGASGSAAEEFCSAYSSIYFRDNGSSPVAEQTAAVDNSQAVTEEASSAESEQSTETSTEESTVEESSSEQTTKKPSATKKETTAKETTAKETEATTTQAQNSGNPFDFLDRLQNIG